MAEKVEFDFGLEKVKVRITDVKGYKTDQDTGESYPYVEAIFNSVISGVKTIHQCRQFNPLKDVKEDVDRIKSGKIAGTNFYKHWIKLFFKNRGECNLIKDGDFVKFKFVGEYEKQDSFRENTFYFKIDGNKEKIKGYYCELNGESYLL